MLSLLQILSLLLEEGSVVAEGATTSGVLVGNWLLMCRFFLCLDLDLLAVEGACFARAGRRLTGEESSSETSNPSPPPLLHPVVLCTMCLEDDSSLFPRILLTHRPSICMKSLSATGDDGVTVDRVVNEDEHEVEEEGVDCQMRWYAAALCRPPPPGGDWSDELERRE